MLDAFSAPGRPLRIALLTHSVNPRGGVVHCLELARALTASGHDVTLMAPGSPGARFFRDPGCKVEIAPVTHTPKDMAEMVGSRIAAYVAHLTPLLQRQSFDILHAHDGIGGNALADLEDAGLIEGHVRTVHHLDHFDDPQVEAWQLRAVRRARRIFCVSRVWCEQLQRDFNIEAAQVSNGVDLARFTPQTQPGDMALARRLGLRTALPRAAAGPEASPILLSVGGVEERKNTLRILQAFRQFHRAHPRAQLVIAGGASLLDHDAYQRAFLQALEESHLVLGESILLTGPLPDADMPALFRLADALVMPSLREGFGLVVLESIASGTPAVVSRMAPFTEYLRTGDCFWADPLDAASIARAMHAATSPSLARSLALAAAPALCERYSWAGAAQTHLRLYRELLPQPALA
jgi:glycosyltransferase-like protein